MLIVDAQIHLWAADRPDRPWPPGGAQRAQKPHPVDRDMALAGMKEAGVDRAVIVPPSWEGERNDVALDWRWKSRRADRSSRAGSASRACSACASRSTPPSSGRG
jgi:predicted TIM-barrel fold metal-dependent hydrolase